MTVAVIVPTLDPDTAMIAQCVANIGDGCEVIVEHDEHRAGFAATCNAAAARTTADVLVFLNDDTVPQPGWLSALTGATESHAIAGAHLFYPDGRTQHSGVFLRRDHAGRLEGYNRQRPASSGEVPAVTGACLAIRRDTWDDLGGFDESYVNGYEDIDLCLRAREAGHSVWFAADSVVVHLESQSLGRFDHAADNVNLLQQRWGHLPIGVAA